VKAYVSGLGPVIRLCVLLIAVQGCQKNTADPVSSSSTPTGPTPAAGQRFVTVGFWQNATCTGEMIGTTAFPVDFGDTGCFTWTGRSGMNSASRFSCGSESFNYTQWTTVTCSGGQVPEGTRKTVTISGCTQGVPPQQYGRILDFSGCTF
jgi:hypothetical protein